MNNSTFFDRCTYYISLILLIVASIVIIRQKKELRLSKKFEIQSSLTYAWSMNNFAFNSKAFRERLEVFPIVKVDSDTIHLGTGIFLLFDYEFCESCLQSELKRIANHYSSRNIGILCLPKVKRELSILSQNPLFEGINFFVLNNSPVSFPNDLGGRLHYIKLVNGIVYDAICIDNMFSDLVDGWLAINLSDRQ